MSLEVTKATVAEVLAKLEDGAWQVPQFQRDFVWNEGQVIGLVSSILAARPIGMITLWEQPDEVQLPLEKISVQDYDDTQSRQVAKYFGDPKSRPKKFYALIDGRQRCTAIAMVFGGLSPGNKDSRFAGGFFLDVAHTDPTKQIAFKSVTEIREEGLDKLAVCIGKGLFPLANISGSGSMFDQWLNYLEAIKDRNNYPNQQPPSEGELNRRAILVREAFRGINDTKLAIYIVPDSYDLEKICDIFETLNLTGTKVSPVDLIHSSLYQETYTDPRGGINLREWIGELGQIDGAVGWADRDDRPELVAQIVTAIYVGLDAKPTITRAAYKKKAIKSVKAGDLLATPGAHWRDVIEHAPELARYIGDFQKVVADGFFPLTDCPYPVSAAIYVSLRWHLTFDDNSNRPFGLDELNSLFTAFFWRNALSGRYNQGFLTQLGDDLRFIKRTLYERGNYSSAIDWALHAQDALASQMEIDIPDQSQLVALLTQGRNTGALQKALLLPLIGRATKDLLAPDKLISFPENKTVELHHIYPRSWCLNNIAGDLASALDVRQAGKNYRESVANLTPLSRVSNQRWKAKSPGQAIIESNLNYTVLSDILGRAFIDDAAFAALTSSVPTPREFWERRALLMADYLSKRMSVRI